MREVCIHLDEALVAFSEPALECRDVGGTEAELGGAMEGANALVFSGKCIDEGASAIGRSIIDDEHICLGRS